MKSMTCQLYYSIPVNGFYSRETSDSLVVGEKYSIFKSEYGQYVFNLTYMGTLPDHILEPKMECDLALPAIKCKNVFDKDRDICTIVKLETE